MISSYLMIPFAILLVGIAVFPLWGKTQHLWEKAAVKLVFALLLGGPVAIYLIATGFHGAVEHSGIEYVQFMCVIGALFVVSSGIAVTGDIRATPRNNVLFLAIGAVLASFIGTTGAAMVMIRPILRTNSERTLKVHTVVFAIFMIANCGGLLTPLGDPPLFLGLLRGVPFTWTLHLTPHWLFVNGLLLFIYYGLDRREYALEPKESIEWDDSRVEPIRIKGKWNIALMLGVVAVVAKVPSIDVNAHAYIPWREICLLCLAASSWTLPGSGVIRTSHNKFSWEPIKEVGALFIGIFPAMIPALLVMKQVAPSLPLNDVSFFVATGSLSAVLDNAPTYATFFEVARTLGGSILVAGVQESFLVSISLGSVFCGAITYIGNGPNFMVKSIAETSGVIMPSFGGYVKWSFRHLVPVLTAMVLLFIAPGMWCKLAGGAITLTLLIFSAYLVVRYKDPHSHLAAQAA